MANSLPPRPVYRRLTQIEDSDLRANATLGVQVTLAAHLAHLRSIKDTEHKWLELYAILILPAIGYVMTVADTCAIFSWPLVVMLLLYLVLTAWLQNLLLRERFSYYAVLRSVIRSQNLLGLFDVNYLSAHFANSAFPPGFGPIPAEDGTQPQSSFRRRLRYVLFLYSALLLAAAFRWWSICQWFMVAPILFFFCGTFLYCHTFWADRKGLINMTAQEEGLAGSEADWFPRLRSGGDP